MGWDTQPEKWGEMRFLAGLSPPGQVSLGQKGARGTLMSYIPARFLYEKIKGEEYAHSGVWPQAGSDAPSLTSN